MSSYNKPRNPSNPPRLADRFFEWYCNNDLMEELQGDLHERFKQDQESKGKYRAKIQYWINVFRFMNKYTLRNSCMKNNSFLIQTSMLKNYIKVAIRHMRRNKSYTAINIFGFAIGLASCIAIFFYVNKETSYDTFHSKSERIYRVTNSVVRSTKTTHYVGTPPALAPTLKYNFPRIEKITRFRTTDDHYFIVNNKRFYEKRVFYADSIFFELFDFELLAGNRKTALSEPNSIVITEDMALKYFNERLPLGKFLEMDGNQTVEVTGILAPIPDNSHITFDMLLSFSTFQAHSGNLADLNSWVWMGFNTYVLLKDNFDLLPIEDRITDLYIENHKTLAKIGIRAHLQPLEKIYLNSTDLDIDDDALTFKYGSQMPLKTLSVIALMILLIAGFNFMSMSTAMSLKRSKEIGIRKVLGAVKSKLIYQFLTESILVAFISLSVALAFIILAKNPINNLFQSSIIPELDAIIAYLPFIILGALLTGILAGLYPSFVLSSFNPIIALKNNLKVSFNKNTFGKSLIILQFIISISLISATLIGT